MKIRHLLSFVFALAGCGASTDEPSAIPAQPDASPDFSTQDGQDGPDDGDGARDVVYAPDITSERDGPTSVAEDADATSDEDAGSVPIDARDGHTSTDQDAPGADADARDVLAESSSDVS